MRVLIYFTALVVWFAFAARTSHSQENNINRQNRTVEVVVTETVSVEPDVADVTVGCLTYGETNELAYQANLQIADNVIKALLSAGLSKGQIQSSALELNETSSNDDQTRTVAKERRFQAHQSWTIRVAASQAQKIIDDAVQAGANGIEGVIWEVSDSAALESRARAEAMKKARATAIEIAESAGGKLGELLYASNTVNGIMGLASRSLQTVTVSAGGGGGYAKPTFSLKLFPAKVEKDATIRAIFALE